jgi:hypothetical protein
MQAWGICSLVLEVRWKKMVVEEEGSRKGSLDVRPLYHVDVG